MTLDEFMKLPGAKEWRGGEMPVEGATLAEAFVRVGGTLTLHAHYFDWAYDGDGFDIIAYREAP